MTGAFPEILRRSFVAVATSTYEDLQCPPLPGVTGEVTTLTEWLCDPRLGERRFVPIHPELAANPTLRQVEDALKLRTGSGMTGTRRSCSSPVTACLPVARTGSSWPLPTLRSCTRSR